MRKTLTYATIFFSFIFISCQKEIDWGFGSSGDLLVKIVEVTIATNDTNIVTFQWDVNKKLILYRSNGTVNGVTTDITYAINRLSDEKIKRIFSQSTLSAGLVDSVIYIPTYQSSGSQLSYFIDSQYTALGIIRDSSAIIYNSSGQVASKMIYTDYLGLFADSSKETYTYDTNGNVTVMTDFSSNGSGGFDVATTYTYTYDSHISAISLGEECFMIIGANSISKNNTTLLVSNSVSSGTTYTTTFSQQQYTSSDKPAQQKLSITPNPPGYDVKAIYYYQ